MFRKKTSSKSPRKKIIIDTIIILIILGFLSTGAIVFWISTFKIPSLDSFDQIKVSQSTKIYDKTGQVLLFDVFQGVKRDVVPFSEISKNVKNATVAIEDKGFYSHGAIKITSIIRSVFANIFSASFGQGGSTITQQVVKNLVLNNDKTITRKLKEWVLSFKLEQEMSKDNILNLYLNGIPYGGSIYGVEEASQNFFGIKASELTLTQSAYLAALPQAPTYYSPYGKNKNKLEDRKNLVLKEMLANNFINKDEYNSAMKEKVVWRLQNDTGIKAPHFVQFVIDYLEKKYGADVLQNGGLKVITTLDYNLQKQAESILKNGATKNEKTFNASNAALVAIDPKTGQILSMVGSRNYFDTKIDGNFNVAIAHRQPGSSFKPFAYAEAFNKGYTPDTILFDVQTEFSSECTPDGFPKNRANDPKICYMPVNYEGTFQGPITMKAALAESINIPAIKTFYLSGMSDVLKLAKDMGVTLGDLNQYGLTLVLGGGEVSLLDMTSAYSVFANEGVRNPYVSILEIKDKNEKILESFQPNPKTVLPKETTEKISDILSDDVARTPLYGAHSLLYIPGRDVAVKTGTTNDYRDAWIIGYTPDITVGMWAGNNDNTPMEKKISGLIVSPMWNAFMNFALGTTSVSHFTKPQVENDISLKPALRGKWQGGIQHLIDKISGKLATQYTPQESLDEILTGGVHSILYWVNKNDPRGDRPTDPNQDSQFNSWEYAVRKWVTNNKIQETNNNIVPTMTDDVHTPDSAPKIIINNPKTGNSYKITEIIPVYTQYSGKYPFKRAEYYLNNNYIGTSNQIGAFNIPISDLGDKIQNVNNTLKVVVYDSMMNKSEASVDVAITE